MENEPMNNKPSSPYMLPMAIVVASIFIGGAVLYKDRLTPIQADSSSSQTQKSARQISAIEKAVLPETGIILPVTWGDLGSKLVSAGAIDARELKAVYNQKEAFSDEYENLLLGQNDDKLKITNRNAGYLLNLFWALGLANKNPILESGEMASPAYGGAGNFASTGGWTIAQGPSTGSGQANAMDHYSRHKFFDLTPEQQALVDKISRGIYRPCCGNSTHFPDCNHGMAMLGFLELMASQGVSEQDMWQAALAVNSYWFPDTYMTIATYMKDRGVEWKDVSPQEILGVNYSSAQGYAKIASQVTLPSSPQSGCSV